MAELSLITVGCVSKLIKTSDKARPFDSQKVQQQEAEPLCSFADGIRIRQHICLTDSKLKCPRIDLKAELSPDVAEVSPRIHCPERSIARPRGSLPDCLPYAARKGRPNQKGAGCALHDRA